MTRKGVWVSLCLWLLVSVGAFAQGMQEDCSVELYEKIFKPTLVTASAPWALVEFFASWCPACQNFKPQYERVACLFNDPKPVHGDEVYVTKVDCGLESNRVLCERFDIQSYPTLYWGPPGKLASGGGSPKRKLGLESVGGGAVNTAEDLLEWINKRIEKEYSLTDKKLETISHKSTSARHPIGHWQLPATLHDVEEATAVAFSYMMDEKMMRSSSRESFLQFTHLMERHHPSERCRQGSAQLLDNIERTWPIRQGPTSGLRNRQLCGPGLPRGYWETCDGEGRGYSCGLWMLFHVLTVQVENYEGTFAISAIEAFVDDFYRCDHCRDHFRNKTARLSLESTSTAKDAVLWLWRTHNKVTESVAREEAKGKGHSRRKLWPPENECPSCRDTTGEDSEWDEEGVYYFLMEWYGDLLKANKSGVYQRSEMVPVEKPIAMSHWAFMSIAFASCGFAIAACYLHRQTQKYKWTKRR